MAANSNSRACPQVQDQCSFAKATSLEQCEYRNSDLLKRHYMLKLRPENSATSMRQWSGCSIRVHSREHAGM